MRSLIAVLFLCGAEFREIAGMGGAACGEPAANVRGLGGVYRPEIRLFGSNPGSNRRPEKSKCLF